MQRCALINAWTHLFTKPSIYVQRQLALCRNSLPSVHRTWVAYRHDLRTRNVWLAQNESPRVSTVLVQLSATLQDLEHLELFLRMGVSSDVHEVCASLLSPQQGRPPQCAICLLIQRGRCNFASLFGTHGALISRTRLPEHWQIAGASPVKAFVPITILPLCRDTTTIIFSLLLLGAFKPGHSSPESAQGLLNCNGFVEAQALPSGGSKVLTLGPACLGRGPVVALDTSNHGGTLKTSCSGR